MTKCFHHADINRRSCFNTNLVCALTFTIIVDFIQIKAFLLCVFIIIYKA